MLLALAGGVASVGVWIKMRWSRIKRAIGLWLLARHIHRCGAECSCLRYAKLTEVA